MVAPDICARSKIIHQRTSRGQRFEELGLGSSAAASRTSGARGEVRDDALCYRKI
jgi:hypothetical protein